MQGLSCINGVLHRQPGQRTFCSFDAGRNIGGTEEIVSSPELQEQGRQGVLAPAGAAIVLTKGKFGRWRRRCNLHGTRDIAERRLTETKLLVLERHDMEDVFAAGL